MSTNFSPSSAELSVVNQVFAHADPQKLGVLTGDVAVRVFTGAKLPPSTLGEIWNIADEDNKGWLSKKGVAIAVRLIGWAQKGERVTQALVNKSGPLAIIEGINTVSQQNTGMSSPRSPPPTASPPLTQLDKVKFQGMFLKSGPVNGILSGDKARDIFVKSKLSNEQLMKIWNLADTQDRGALDSIDFAIGMYFIQGAMTNKIAAIPASLPPGLYQQAGGVGSAGSVRSHTSGNSGSFSPVGSSFAAQQAGSAQALQPDITGLSGNFKPPLPARPMTLYQGNGHAHGWDVTPTEKASSDRLFDTLDTQKRGYIDGDVAVPFMLGSKLPGDVLAQIWDLADINNDGSLTRDGFAVAMYLIQKKLSGQEIPTTLPPSLLPPSARASTLSGSPFSAASAEFQRQQEPPHDLFSFDDTPPPSAVHPQITGAVKPQVTGPAIAAFLPASSSQALDNDPFTSSPFQAVPSHDLLSGDDTHGTTSPPLQDQSAEIGNLKNQLQSTNRSLATAQEERANIELTLANQASQLSSMQTQLSSAKAAYETETSSLVTLKGRRVNQVSEIEKTREDLIRAESDLSAIRVEKAEIEGALLRDKEEARDLHRRMIEASQQAEGLKVDVEKLKKETKQQKGLLAIARKQLSTKEIEKARAEKEHEEAVAELTFITQEKDNIEAELTSFVSSPPPKSVERTLLPADALTFAASQPLPATPELSGSGAKSNNPFERLAMSSGNPTQSQSPLSFLSQESSGVDSPSLDETTVSPETNDEKTSLDVSAASPNLTNETELSYLDKEAPLFQTTNVVSPVTANGTDYFVTPPTSAIKSASFADPLERFPSLNNLSPSIPGVRLPTPSIAVNSETHPNTDLNAQLKDLDIDDSDSDGSADETSVHKLGPSKEQAPEPSSEAVKDESSSHVILPATTTTFDDIFGSDERNIHSNADGQAPPSDLAVSPQPKATIAGVNEFDEAMGKISTTVTTAGAFSFDTTFDDHFDFASASQSVELTPPTNIKPTLDQKAGFEEIFATNKTTPLPLTTSTTDPPPILNSVPTLESSFDEVFVGFDTVATPNAESKSKVSAESPTPTPMPDEPSIPGSFPSISASPQPSAIAGHASPARLTEMRAASPPPRQNSPPPRIVSPKPRLSSSSSKDTHEKNKEPPPRHSKLSIRLPFGKRKKAQEPLPPQPSHHLAPPTEEPHRTTTPATEDDVEPVKQLTAMGFSRGQAVNALEKYGYDVQKALNSLLGAQ